MPLFIALIFAVTLPITIATIPKHILLVVIDDLGYADLGFTGSQINTPTIDALAATGVVLKSFYVQRACSPSRASLLTGRYNIRYGFQSGVLKDVNPYSLPLNETLLPAFVKKAVPVSAAHMIGKWHLGYNKYNHTPAYRGFDSFLGYFSGGADYYTHEADCGGYDMFLQDGAGCGPGCARPMWEARGVYSTHLFSSRAVDIINAHDPATNGTLFLYLPFQGVHVPDQVPASYMAPYNFPPVEGTNARNFLAGMLSCVDEGIANITAALKAKGMWEETLTWVQTDNGAATPACGGWSGAQNYPLRGGKCTLWEGGQRGTALISGAGIDVARRGTTEEAIMHNIDVLPTLIEALGGNATALVKSGFELDGISQWRMLSDGTGPQAREEVLLEADPFADPIDNHPSVGFQCGGDEHATRYYGMRSRQWKLMIGDPGATYNRTNIGSGWWCTGPPCPADHNNTRSVGGPYPIDGVLLYDVVADPRRQRTSQLSTRMWCSV